MTRLAGALLLLLLYCLRAEAQSAADSMAIMEALGAAFATEPVTGVADRYACYHAPVCTAAELAAQSASRLLKGLARAAGIPLLPTDSMPRPPPCPDTGETPDAGGTGYQLYVGVPRIEAGRAVIAVGHACSGPPTWRAPLMWGEDYVLEARDGVWHVVERRRTWIS